MNLSEAIAGLDLDRFAADNLAGPRRGGDEIRASCPRCAKDEKLWINVRKRAWVCYYCVGADERARGGVVALVMWVLGLGEVDACRWIMQRAQPGHRRLDHLESALSEAGGAARVIVRPLPEMPLPEKFWPAPMHPYAVSRGIPMLVAAANRLGACVGGKYHARLILPCVSDGRVVYWQARAMWKLRHDDRKVLNPENSDCGCRRVDGTPDPRCAECSGTGCRFASASEVLFGFDSARRYRRVAVAEGPISAMRIGPDAVATLGKKISVVQALRLAYAGVREVDLMWDADAIREVLRAAPWLSALFLVRTVVLPWGDPADREPAENTALRMAAPVFEPSAYLMRV